MAAFCWFNRPKGDPLSRSEEAVERFRSGSNCSQAVLATYAEDYDLDLDLALKIACGLGGGIGRTAQTCGAVTGAVLVLGLAESGPDPTTPAAKTRVYGLVKSFIHQFTERHQTISCHELLGCDIGTTDGYMDAQRLELFQTRCPKYVEDAVEILDSLLQRGA
jgi:C_GCAxxG_C_C family probable redox protein